MWIYICTIKALALISPQSFCLLTKHGASQWGPLVWHASCFYRSVSRINFFLQSNHFHVVSCHTWVKQILGVLQIHRDLLIEIPDVADLWNPPFLSLIFANLYWPLFWAESSFKVLSQCDTHSTKPADKSTGFPLLQPSFHAFMHSFRQSQALRNSPREIQAPVSVLQGHMLLTILISWLMVATTGPSQAQGFHLPLCRPS